MQTIRIFAIVFAFLVTSLSAKIVVIDAGHGGHDMGGKCGRVYEKHLALDTAMRLEHYLKELGYRTVMLRRSDVFLSLSQRASLANRYPGAIFVSIHYNFAWKSHVEGVETFYYSNSSHALAANVQSSILRRTGAVNRKVKHARYYVLRQCQLPSILVEGGFVSHNGECTKLKKGTYRDQLVRGIVDGIVRYDRSGAW